MRWFELVPQTLKELRKLVQEFRMSPFPATKTLIIFSIFVVTVVTQWTGYTQNVSYGWMICGLFLIVIALLATLRIAYELDRKKA